MKIKHILLFVVLLICGSLSAQDHYPYSSSVYPYNMAFRVQILIDGVEQTTSDIEVAAFNGSICTNSSRVKSFTSSNYYRANMTIKGESAYAITFKLYNHATEEELLYYTLTSPEGTQLDGINWVQGTASTYANPYVLNFQHTNTLPISAYTETGNWYLISSPLATSVAPTAVENMIPANAEQGYDLFYFDQTQDLEWVTYKSSGEIDPGFTNIGGIVPGKGYLYANSQAVDLVFAGAPYTESSLNVTIKNVSGHRSAGWNLIGNPYSVPAEARKAGENFDYYVMNGVGDDFAPGSGYVRAMNGIMVYAQNATETVTFTPANGDKAEDDSEMIALNLSRENGNVLDRVVVRIGEGSALPKYVLNANNAHVSAVMNGEEYAVVNGTNAFLIPVNFNADKMGRFTLSTDIQRANMDYLHLIDNLTGEDIDLLLEGSYSFTGTPDDMNQRFMLRLRYHGFDGVEEIFAYQNGSDIIVAGEGTLQVFDVMGRFVSSHEINGVQTIQALPMGVYVLRLVGDGVKTQKIVVR